MNDIEKFRTAETTNEREVETTLEQINRVQDVLEQQKATLTKDRGMFGKAMRFFQEKVMRTDTAEKALDQKIVALEKRKQALKQDAGQLESVQQYLQQEHAGEALATSGDNSGHLQELAATFMEESVRSGKELSEEDAAIRAKTLLSEEDKLMADFFAEGDAMNKQDELEQAAQEMSTTQYKEKIAAAQPSVEAKIAALQETALDEREINDELAMEKKAGETQYSINPEIAAWFNRGTAMNLAAEIDQANSPITEAYRAELKRGSQSTRAQMKAFEGLLTGRFSVPKFSSIIEKIRKEFGPGSTIDKNLRDGSEAELATQVILDKLKRLPGYDQVIKKYAGLEIYNVGGEAGTELVIMSTKPKKRVVASVESNFIGSTGIDQSEIDRLLPSSLEQIIQYAEDGTEMSDFTGEDKAAAAK